MVQHSKLLQNVILTVAAVSLAACSTAPEKQYQDPLEGVNRKIYGFNETVDKYVLKPVAQGYRFVTPNGVEDRVHNFFVNLFYPTVFVNSFLQGKHDEGFQGLNRFVFNSTLGLGGVHDVASEMGLKPREEDFGQTFAKWGFGSGPYIVVPILGGYTMRDGLGDVAAIPINPGYWVKDSDIKLGLMIGVTIDRSAQLLEARDLVTGDKYLFTRDSYLQRRRHLIADGEAQEEDPFLND